MTRGTTRPPARGRALAVVGALLVAGLVGAAPVAVADDACRGASDGGGLPPGTHDVALTSALSGGGDVGPGGFTLTVDYAADVRVVVGEDGRVRDASADVDVRFDGGITGIPVVGGGLAGHGSGRLALDGIDGIDGDTVRLTGEVDGLGSLTLTGLSGGGLAVADSATETLTLDLVASCGHVTGTATSQTMADSLAELRGAGLAAEATPMTFSVGEPAPPEVQEIRDELAAIEQLPPRGPDRRFATSRLRKAYERITALDETHQECLLDAWHDTVRAVLQARVDADVAVVASLEPTSADLGAFHGAVASLLESEKQYQLLGLDACSADDRRPAFDAIAAAAERHIAHAIEQGRVVDVVRLTRDFSFVGLVSPALAEEADAAIDAAVEEWVRTTSTLLARLADEARATGDRECSADDGAVVRKAVVAAKQAAAWGSEPPVEQILRDAEALGCAS